MTEICRHVRAHRGPAPAQNDDGTGTTPVACRFANEPLSWEMLTDYVCMTCVTLVEIPSSPPTYNDVTATRVPPAAPQTALLSRTWQIIPLLTIQPSQVGYSRLIPTSWQRRGEARRLGSPQVVVNRTDPDRAAWPYLPVAQGADNVATRGPRSFSQPADCAQSYCGAAQPA